jgi:hypothetical protein
MSTLLMDWMCHFYSKSFWGGLGSIRLLVEGREALPREGDRSIWCRRRRVGGA